MAILGVQDWKSLGVFADDTMLYELTFLYFGSIALWFVLYFISKATFPVFLKMFFGPDNEYFGMKERTQNEYHSRNVSDIHTLVAAPLALYSCYNVCDNPEKSIFNDQECLMKPHRVQLYLIAVSSGYVTYDCVIILTELGYTLKTGSDFVFHHVVGVIGAVAVLIAGRFNVALSAGNLVSEWSNFVMNLRWRLLKHKMTDGLFYLGVNALFMIAYIIVRIVFLLMLLIRNYQIQQVFDIFSDPPVVYGCAIVSLLLQVMLYLIQLFWFKLIVGAFLRTLRGQKPTIAGKDN